MVEILQWHCPHCNRSLKWTAPASCNNANCTRIIVKDNTKFSLSWDGYEVCLVGEEETEYAICEECEKEIPLEDLPKEMQ